jgi:AhpD family alkylhydroperoxidase
MGPQTFYGGVRYRAPMDAGGGTVGGRRTYASLRAVAHDLAATLRQSPAARPDRALVPPDMRERIMLAVTQVNGCRWCSFAHSRMALRAGVPPEEVRSLLGACVDGCPDAEATALLYAQHWTEAQGRTDPVARERLVGAYGPERAEAIERVIRAMNTANLVGNTIDAVMSRLTRGRWTRAIRVDWTLRVPAFARPR